MALRLFIAIDTPASVRSAMAALREEVAPRARGFAWEAREKYHCTVQFLGDVERTRLGEITASVREATAGISPLRLAYRGLGFFPSTSSPRVFWVGIEDCTGSLGLLRDRIARALAPLGFPPEERPFHPHVTLARARAGADARTLIDTVQRRTFEHPPVTVPAVEIMQSVPVAGGTAYTVLASLGLPPEAGS
ncbi:MAG TPA: RNA 2',3'-cyclic phosphodiesterase [Bacteroidota bacterium]|nr:RNA 2',3'-cyclic phosphodiesterase [Bacteroidota bacterium]